MVFLFVLDRKQCILVCHDWGTIIGWQFLTKYKFMVQKYVIMGAPPRGIFSQLFRDAADQFKRSWYIIFFQMPIVPELAVSAEDYSYFFALWKNKFNENFTEDDLEAYKHMLSLGSYKFYLIYSSIISYWREINYLVNFQFEQEA